MGNRDTIVEPGGYWNAVHENNLDDPLLVAPVKAAVFRAVGDLYENREGQADRQLFSNPIV